MLQASVSASNQCSQQVGFRLEWKPAFAASLVGCLRGRFSPTAQRQAYPCQWHGYLAASAWVKAFQKRSNLAVPIARALFWALDPGVASNELSMREFHVALVWRSSVWLAAAMNTIKKGALNQPCPDDLFAGEAEQPSSYY